MRASINMMTWRVGKITLKARRKSPLIGLPTTTTTATEATVATITTPATMRALVGRTMAWRRFVGITSAMGLLCRLGKMLQCSSLGLVSSKMLLQWESLLWQWMLQVLRLTRLLVVDVV
ncbi:hypothetical protein ACFX15_022184 [Malus domestica]